MSEVNFEVPEGIQQNPRPLTGSPIPLTKPHGKIWNEPCNRPAPGDQMEPKHRRTKTKPGTCPLEPAWPIGDPES